MGTSNIEKITDILLRKPKNETMEEIRDKTHPPLWIRCGEIYLDDKNDNVYFCAFCFKKTKKFGATFTTPFAHKFWQHVRLTHKFLPISLNVSSSSKSEDAEEVVNSSIKSSNSIFSSPARKRVPNGLRSTQYLPIPHTIKRRRDNKLCEEYSTKSKVSKISENYDKYKIKKKHELSTYAKVVANDEDEEDWDKVVATNVEATKAKQDKETISKKNASKPADVAEKHKDSKIEKSPTLSETAKIHHSSPKQHDKHDKQSKGKDMHGQHKNKLEKVSPMQQTISKFYTSDQTKHKETSKRSKSTNLDETNKSPSTSKSPNLEETNKSPSTSKSPNLEETNKSPSTSKSPNLEETNKSPSTSKSTNLEETNKSPSSSKSEIIDKNHKSHKKSSLKHKSQHNADKSENKLNQKSEERNSLEKECPPQTNENNEKLTKEITKHEAKEDNKAHEKSSITIDKEVSIKILEEQQSPADQNVTESTDALNSCVDKMVNESILKTEVSIIKEPLIAEVAKADLNYDELNLISKFVNEEPKAKCSADVNEVFVIDSSDSEEDTVIDCFKYVEEDDDCDYQLYIDTSPEEEVSSSTDVRYTGSNVQEQQHLAAETILSSHLQSKSVQAESIQTPVASLNGIQEQQKQPFRIPLLNNRSQPAPVEKIATSAKEDEISCQVQYACHVCAAAFKTERGRESHYKRKHRGTTTDAWVALREELHAKAVLEMLKREPNDENTQPPKEPQVHFVQPSVQQQPKPTAPISAHLNIREPQQIPVYYHNHEYYDNQARLHDVMIYNSIIAQSPTQQKLNESFQAGCNKESLQQHKQNLTLVHKEALAALRKKHTEELLEFKKKQSEQLAAFKKQKSKKVNTWLPEQMQPLNPAQQTQFSQQRNDIANPYLEQRRNMAPQPTSRPIQMPASNTTQHMQQQANPYFEQGRNMASQPTSRPVQIPASNFTQQMQQKANPYLEQGRNLTTQSTPFPVQYQPEQMQPPPPYSMPQKQFSSAQQRHDLHSSTYLSNNYVKQQVGGLFAANTPQNERIGNYYAGNVAAPHFYSDVININVRDQRSESNQFAQIPTDYSTSRTPFNS